MENIKCPGFKAAGVASGIKKNDEPDLGIIFSEVPSNVAGIFTRNRVQAAPVLLDRQRIESGSCRAVIANSGNANCCTGEQGMRDAVSMAAAAAKALRIPEESVLVGSTGVIGAFMPINKVKAAIPGLVESLSSGGFVDFARAIMTTDTVPKSVSRQGEIDGKPFTVTGAAKGVGMIEPNMATMLCFLCTDIGAEPKTLRQCLMNSAEQSFNRITVDGDMSTNDTAILMANGVSGIEIWNPGDRRIFQNILDDVTLQLARRIVKDGEGATKLVEISVKGALSDADARTVAQSVANSSLVKTALFGEDANWGRVIMAVGKAGVEIDPKKIDIFFDDVLMCKNGLSCGEAVEEDATRVLKKPEFSIFIDLHLGQGAASMLTCDFSVDYVKINADYRS
jgi:glutamate N-acetyltransferase/amino-acid N-acetyltransferase